MARQPIGSHVASCLFIADEGKAGMGPCRDGPQTGRVHDIPLRNGADNPKFGPAGLILPDHAKPKPSGIFRAHRFAQPLFKSGKSAEIEAARKSIQIRYDVDPHSIHDFQPGLDAELLPDQFRDATDR